MEVAEDEGCDEGLLRDASAAEAVVELEAEWESESVSESGVADSGASASLSAAVSSAFLLAFDEDASEEEFETAAVATERPDEFARLAEEAFSPEDAS